MTVVGGLEGRSTLVVIGAGGVGKTTTAAALGLLLAERGQRVCVLTIDPARRLAAALGLTEVGNEPVQATPELPGFYAAMLDPKRTFDDMIARYASSPAQAEAIVANPVYHNLVTRLSGTQEYMAFERLWELRANGRFDVIIVDTPPAQAAIDFLHAPERLAGFLENRVFRFMLRPPPLYLRPLALATRALVKQIASVVGAQVVDDTIEFFQAFQGIEDGFRARAQQTDQLLRSKDTAYLLVSTAEPQALAASAHLVELLAGIGHSVDLTVLNRLTPDFAHLPSDPVADEVARVGAELLATLRAEEVARARAWTRRLALEAAHLVDDLGETVASLEGLSAVARALESSLVLEGTGG
jgi:anion-transporting  ArsA/GET3 family ATPase